MISPAHARLVLSALAASYLAYVLAVFANFALPGLVLGSRPGAEIEWVRVSPLAVRVSSSGEATGQVASLTRAWELAGGLLALAAARACGPALRLVLLQTACWWFLLRLLLAVAGLMFGRNWRSAVWPVLPALAGLMLSLWALARFTEPYVPAARSRRAAAVAITFSLPAVVAIITLGRWTGSAVALVLLVGATVAALGLLASALAPATEEQRDWSPSAGWRSAAAALLVAAGLALYPYAHRAAQDLALARVSSAYHQILYPGDAYRRADIERVAAECDQALRVAAGRLGVSADGLRLRVFLYPTSEARIVRTGTTVAWTADAREIHAVLPSTAAPATAAATTVAAAAGASTAMAASNSPASNPITGNSFAPPGGRLAFDPVAADGRPSLGSVAGSGRLSLDPVADATAMVLARWGEPGLPFLREAAAVFAAGQWRGRALGDWAAQITAEEGPYSLAQLGDDSAFLSPLVRRPLAGEFAAWVGRQRLHALYTAEPGGPDWRVPLEDGWRRHLRELAAGWRAPPQRAPDSCFHKGIAFSHEGGPRGGYASLRAAQVLESFPGMGVNAVSLQPYAFLRRGDLPSLRMFTAESDEALDHATAAARRAGLRVALKPQIWLGGRQWSGDIAFLSAEDWQAWWAQYRQWILHYARLAEMNGTALFVVGTELGGTTAAERGQERAWRRIIADVRRVYHGPLTYAAHWGREFETLPFWDALDSLGLNFYYPLASDKERRAPSAEVAERVAQTIEQVHRRWNKPVLFTEIGFPSASGAAREPWRENPSDAPDPPQQERCYELVFRTFYHRPWLAGVYWWKWYSTGRGGGEADRLYTPMNKPAARVIARWYGDSERR